MAKMRQNFSLRLHGFHPVQTHRLLLLQAHLLVVGLLRLALLLHLHLLLVTLSLRGLLLRRHLVLLVWCGDVPWHQNILHALSYLI